MQLSAPHGSIVILGGSRLFWNVCEAQWVTESTFTLTHVCNIINLDAAGVGARTHKHNTARTGADKLTHKVTHTDKYTLNALKAWQAKPPVGLGSLLSSTEQNSQGSRLEEGDPVCLNTVPCQGLCFWGWQLSAAG